MVGVTPPVGGKLALETSCPSTSDTTKQERCSLGWYSFALRPAGGKPYGCRCGQGVGEMPVPACRRAYLFEAATAAPVGNVSEHFS